MTGIDWQGATRKGQLMQALHLFACQLAWLRHGDERAYDELIRASEHADPEIRVIAAALLLDSPIADSRNHLGGQHGREDRR